MTSDRSVRCLLGGLFGLSLLASTAAAQSGSQLGSQVRPASPAPVGSDQRRSASGAPDGSGSAMRGEPMVAMRGFCPVCVVELKQWVKGDPRFQTVVDGKVYYFPDQDVRAKFNANPNKYLPALGGDDVVTYVRTGRREPASLAYGVLHGGRPFFFASDANKRQFIAAPAMYATADLALGGECVVCRVDMQQSMPGRGDASLVHGGLRYQFVGVEQQQRFLANPTPYVNAAVTAGPSVGSATKGSSGTQGSGTQGSGGQPGSDSQPAPRPRPGSGTSGSGSY